MRWKDGQRTLWGRYALRNELPAAERVWRYASLVDLGSLPPGAPGKEVAQGRRIWLREGLQKSRQSRLEVTGEAPALSEALSTEVAANAPRLDSVDGPPPSSHSLVCSALRSLHFCKSGLVV
jgi:hypothetical protein